ncbi:MAG: hypothetical protein P9M00_06415 [Candidatus Tritonobacter lacicola]|nr:hypothetical protein [Candidatus Tritonobacter lacicola]
MTKLLSKAFQKASLLPEDLQNQLAQELLEEIEWEKAWDESLTKSQDKLISLAEKAVREYEAGKTKQMGFDEL